MNLFSTNQYTSSRIDLFAEAILKQTETKENDYLIIDPYSIGDVVHTLSLIDAFKLKYCLKETKINLLCNERCVGVAKLFKNINKVFGMNCGPYEFQFESLVGRFPGCRPGIPMVITPDMHSNGWLGRLCSEGRINCIEAKKLILELDINTESKIPKLEPKKIEHYKVIADKIGLNKKTALIFNHANTIKSINPDIFINLDKIFEKIFYDDSVNPKGVIPNAIPIKMTIEELPYIANCCGAVINIRSGITDLLSFCDTKIYTIYPNSNMMMDFVGDKYKAAQSFLNLSLRGLKLGNFENEIQIIINENEDLYEVSEKLTNIIKNDYKSI